MARDKKIELYFSTDVENDGPIPGANSMLSLGSAAYHPDGRLLGTFSRNLETLPGAKPSPKTMEEFWDKEPDAWAACRQDPVPPEQAMREFAAWIEEISERENGKPVFVAYPAGHDFLFVYWYLITFLGASAFSFSALDMKSLAMAILGTAYRESVNRNMPADWFADLPHTHIAVDDAVEQGYTMMAMLRAAGEMRARAQRCLAAEVEAVRLTENNKALSMEVARLNAELDRLRAGGLADQDR